MRKLSQKIRNGSKFIRYAVGGWLAALIDLFFLWVFTDQLGIYYLTSQALSFLISFTFGFYFQKYLTFRDFTGRHGVQALLFLFFQIIGLGINLVILKWAVEYLGIHYLIGSIIAKGVVFIWNYIMNHFFNFSGEKWK